MPNRQSGKIAHQRAGRFTTEEWDCNARTGKSAVLIANRFMVQAKGSGGGIDDLKVAVAAVGPDRLEALA